MGIEMVGIGCGMGLEPKADIKSTDTIEINAGMVYYWRLFVAKDY